MFVAEIIEEICLGIGDGDMDRTRPRPKVAQLSLALGNAWGGRRKGAGRKPRPGLQRVAHRTRPAHCERHPLHVTLRSELKDLRHSFVFPTLKRVFREL